MTHPRRQLFGLMVLSVAVPTSARVIATSAPDPIVDRAYSPDVLTITEARRALLASADRLDGASIDLAQRTFALECSASRRHDAYGRIEFTGGKWVARVTHEEWACRSVSGP